MPIVSRDCFTQRNFCKAGKFCQRKAGWFVKAKKKQMPDVNYLLVDGYNIIFAWEELKVLAQTDIAAARGKTDGYPV